MLFCSQGRFSHRIRGTRYLGVLSALLVVCIVPGPAGAWDGAFATSSQPAQTDGRQPSDNLSLVRVFSSADDVRPVHPLLGRTLDIVAGPAEPGIRLDALQSPSAVVTDSNRRVFVADPGAHAVHVFDFIRSKYARLDARGEHLHAPTSLSVDGQDNLYVVDQSSRTVFVYDSGGRFRGELGKLRGRESYFDSPAGITIDGATGRIYVCDRLGHMIFVMDKRGRLIRKLGNRGGGERPGEFRLPSQVVLAAGELFVLDAGNARIQVLDTGGRFLRVINLGYADPGTGLAVDSQDDIYVSDPALNQIEVFRHDGQMLYRFDPSKIKGASFGHPSGMWVDAGHSLYVVDSQSHRVGMFQIKAEKVLR